MSREAVIEALAALCHGPDHLAPQERGANNLRAAGTKGIPGNPCFCPVARRLCALGFAVSGVFPGLPRGQVFAQFAVSGTEESIPLPLAVDAFAIAFDKGDYPELDETRREVAS